MHLSAHQRKKISSVCVECMYMYMYTYCLQLQFESPRLFLCFAQLGLNRRTVERERVTDEKDSKQLPVLTYWYTVLTKTEHVSGAEAGAAIYYRKCAIHSLSLLHFFLVLLTMPVYHKCSFISFQTRYLSVYPPSRGPECVDKAQLSSTHSQHLRLWHKCHLATV